MAKSAAKPAGCCANRNFEKREGTFSFLKVTFFPLFSRPHKQQQLGKAPKISEYISNAGPEMVFELRAIIDSFHL
jgi:hypothetical protein